MLFHLVKRLRFFKMDCRTFSFSNYDSIGFDLDHTISLYQLDNVINLQYQLLVNYLVKNGYDSNVFPSTLSNKDVDFIQRGLFLDFKRGNILKIAHDGTILCGTHGTTRLTEKDISASYGDNKRWDLTDRFVCDMMSTWNPPISDNMRSMMEFFDCQVPLVFGKVIDFVDGQSKQCPNEYSVWPTILDGIVAMFEPNGGFYEALNEKPELYLRKCSDDIVKWMDSLKKDGKLLFLLTGSREKEASFLADYCLGKDWKRHFEIIVYHAKKPGFFSHSRPFLEKNIVSSDIPLELTQGNWAELYSLISKKKSLTNLKCVYIGDHLIQDIYATSFNANIDAIALVQEIAEEEIFTCQENFNNPPYGNYLKSKFWGSYLFNGDGKTLTVWGDLMKKHSKLNIPDLNYLADKPVNHEHKQPGLL